MYTYMNYCSFVRTEKNRSRIATKVIPKIGHPGKIWPPRAAASTKNDQNVKKTLVKQAFRAQNGVIFGPNED